MPELPVAQSCRACYGESVARTKKAAAFADESLRRLLRYPRPFVAVDLVVFTISDADLKVLLVRRGEPPFQGYWALPGGFVRSGPASDDQGEDVDAAAARELAEETGLATGTVYLEQLYTFGRAGRDPRYRVISVAYFALVKPSLAPLVRAGGDASDAAWHSMSETDEGRSLQLAFDHTEILAKALARIRAKVDYSDIAFELVPDTFSIPELRSVHEVIKGQTYDAGNFRRRFLRMTTDGIIAPAPGRRITTSKPAKVFRFMGHPTS
ncbi:MAG: NUDIX hydrolase [Deltaproteobacteria bacterium]|nr:NUDIX hydrolase [Deltaproteobacteria bacterium]